MHPVLRQSPPSRSDSTIATRAFAAAAIYADTNPAEPAPMTTRLYSKKRGRVHRMSSTASSQEALGQVSRLKSGTAHADAKPLSNILRPWRGQVTSTAFYSTRYRKRKQSNGLTGSFWDTSGARKTIGWRGLAAIKILRSVSKPRANRDQAGWPCVLMGMAYRRA